MILFYHLEKTAGSSLRDAFVAHFGRGRCEGMYGPRSSSTTPGVSRIAYPEADDGCSQRERLDRVIAFLDERRPRFFSSHALHVMRPDMPPDSRSLAMFREPVARVVSHYNHWRQRGYYTASFEAFVEDERFRNWQSRRISKAQMLELDCVGIAESFEPSIALINATLNVSLKPVHRNRTGWRPFQASVRGMDEALRDRIRRLNESDVELYAAARTRHREQLARLSGGPA